jgi:hypothetical protein
VGLLLLVQVLQPVAQNAYEPPDISTKLNYAPAIAATGNVLTC